MLIVSDCSPFEVREIDDEVDLRNASMTSKAKVDGTISTEKLIDRN